MKPASQVITKISIQESGEPQFCQFTIRAPGSARWVSVSLGYRRSTDFDCANQPGQDYAIVRGGYGSVVGVVADGVSQSFYGHLAARFVAESLLEYLWERRETPPSSDQLHRVLRDFERKFKTEIDGYVLPAHLLSLQRDALEQTRRQSGSQAVFVALVLNAQSRSLRLFEVGDALAVVHCARGDTNGSHSKVIQADHRGRWSSAGRTDLLLEEVNEQDVKGIVIKSDGAKDWGASLASHKFNQAAFFEVAPEFASYDDVSFVAAVFQDESSEEMSATAASGFRNNPSARSAMDISTVPQPRLPRPQPTPSSSLAGDPDLEQSFYVHTSKPAKRRRDWATFALGSGAGFLLAVIGLLGLLWGKVIMLKPKAPDCKVTLISNQITVTAAKTPGELNVRADKKCKWSATGVPSWINIDPPLERNGDGRLSFLVSQNTGPEREEAFDVGGNKFWVKQNAGCDYQLEPESKNFAARGGSERFKIKTGADCAWEASPDQGWIKITKNREGKGDSEVTYTIEPSHSPAREGFIRIGAKRFRITQANAEQKPAKKTDKSPAPGKKNKTPN